MKTKTINVPIDELKPGDIVQLGPATVKLVEHSLVLLRLCGGMTLYLSPDDLPGMGATATRKVPEPEFNLTWADALNQMVTHGRMCKPDCEDCRYRYVEGIWRAYPSLSDDHWVEILLHLSTPAQKALVKAKWRIVEDENGN